MPELPEVEAIAGFLADRAVGRVVARVDVVAVNVLKTYDPPVTALGGLEVTAVRRHGKFLDVQAGGVDAAEAGVGVHLVLHLARAGRLRWRDELPSKPPRPGKGPLALRVHLDEGGLDVTEAGTQKRLAAYVVRSACDVPGLTRLGVDPLSSAFTVATLADLLAERRGQIKGVLCEQSAIAGIGNAYSDEALHAAGLSPFKPAANLTRDEVESLHTAVTGTLRDAAQRSTGLSAGELEEHKRSGLRVHGRTGQPCPVCGDTVREVSFSDSSLQYCPTCQTGGKPLADRRLSRLLK